MDMIWDKLSSIYDATLIAANAHQYQMMGQYIVDILSPEDTVLECACGTGTLSVPIAQHCKKLIATDYSEGMVRQTAMKLQPYPNASVEKVDIMHLPFEDDVFDIVVAANVIHLLDDAKGAIKEMLRVCRPGGKVVIPTFVSRHKITAQMAASMATFAGIKFVHHWDTDTYKEFFTDDGYDPKFDIIDGRMPCVIAVITKS